MKKLAVAAIAAFVLAGCASTPPSTIVVSGNGKCHPAQALPAHKAVKQIEPADTEIGPLYDKLVDERKEHGIDVRDYNQLYDECVDKGTPAAAEKGK
jgi:hypothetical protein